jgi:hypothetical protein
MDLKDTERDKVDCSRLVHGMNQWRVLLLTVKKIAVSALLVRNLDYRMAG